MGQRRIIEYAVVLAAFAAGRATVMQGRLQATVQDEVVAKRIVVTDAQGRHRIVLDAGGDGPLIRIRDEDGRSRVALGRFGDDVKSEWGASVYSEKSEKVITVGATERGAGMHLGCPGKTASIAMVASQEAALVAVGDAREKSRIEMGFTESQGAMVLAWDARGEVKTGIKVQDDGRGMGTWTAAGKPLIVMENIPGPDAFSGLNIYDTKSLELRASMIVGREGRSKLRLTNGAGRAAIVADMTTGTPAFKLADATGKLRVHIGEVGEGPGLMLTDSAAKEVMRLAYDDDSGVCGLRISRDDGEAAVSVARNREGRARIQMTGMGKARVRLGAMENDDEFGLRIVDRDGKSILSELGR